MTQRSMILSAFLAALVLVVIGGVVANLTEPAPVEVAQADLNASQALGDRAATAEPETGGVPTDPPGESVALAEREDQYRRLIEEANRRLVEQQQALDAARRRVAETEAARPTLASAVAYYDDDDDEHERHEDDDDDDEHERGDRWERNDD